MAASPLSVSPPSGTFGLSRQLQSAAVDLACTARPYSVDVRNTRFGSHNRNSTKLCSCLANCQRSNAFLVCSIKLILPRRLLISLNPLLTTPLLGSVGSGLSTHEPLKFEYEGTWSSMFNDPISIEKLGLPRNLEVHSKVRTLASCEIMDQTTDRCRGF